MVYNSHVDEDAKMAPNDLNAYRDAVLRMIEIDGDQPISNGMPEHAAILYECFFAKAQKEVKIFCENLKNSVFGKSEVVENARLAMRRGVEFKILTRKQPEDGPFFVLAHSVVGTLRLLGERVPANSNFAVVDGKRYRFEPDPTVYRAVACMNAPEISKKLSEFFDLLFERGE